MSKEYKNELKEYYTKPIVLDDINSSNKLYMGIEFEFIDNENGLFIDNEGCIIEDYNSILNIVNNENRKLIDWSTKHNLLAKKDSSVDLELVTAPLLKEDLEQTACELLNYIDNNTHLIAWDEGRCGLHIHANKKAIKSVKKLYNFFYDYKNIFKLLSGRKNTQYCSFDSTYLYNNYHYKRGRYTALNFCNPHTVEFRLWRGSLSIPRTLMYIAITHTMCKNSHYLNKLTISEVLFLCDNEFLFDFMQKIAQVKNEIKPIFNDIVILKRFFNAKKWQINIKNLLKFKKFMQDFNQYSIIKNTCIEQSLQDNPIIEQSLQDNPIIEQSLRDNPIIDEAIPF